MAKEQLHSWGRYILIATTIIFACGGWVYTVRDNTKDIGILQDDTKVLQRDVHKLELADKDIANMAQMSVDFMIKIDSTLDQIKTVQAAQRTIQAVNSEKLKTLTKD